MSRATFFVLIILAFALLLTITACDEDDPEGSANRLATAEARGTQIHQTYESALVSGTEAHNIAATTLAPLETQMKQSQRTFGRNVMLIMCASLTVFFFIMLLIAVLFWANRLKLAQEIEKVDDEIEMYRAALDLDDERQQRYRNYHGRPPRDNDPRRR